MSTTMDTPASAPAQGAAQIVALLTSDRGGRFVHQDAERLAATHSPQRVLDVIENAEWLRAQGKLQNRRGYIIKALEEDYPLLDPVQQRRDEQRVPQKTTDGYHRAAIGVLGQVLDWAGDQAKQWFETTFGGVEQAVRERLVKVNDIFPVDHARTWRRLQDVARDRAGSRPGGLPQGSAPAGAKAPPAC